MNEIRLLDKNTIDRIAAGEVIERPSNVVKELIENSIDSGAANISVEIRDGGKSLIRITDNGCGIPKEQIRKAFLRHSTSKIINADDLPFVTTLGFRGEALSSIAAVSDVELCTKTAGDVSGIIYRICGGEEISFEEAGLPEGTTFIIRDIFKNVPARLKFLSSNQTEGNIISEIIEKIALSHPEISFKFTNNGSVRLNTSGNGSLKDVIYAVFGRQMASNLLDIHYSGEILSIDGYIGKPEIARSNRSFENYFVNGRYVKDKIISAAIEESYKGFQMKGSFPFTVFNIRIEPELMDVNVHPSKMEIRFYDNELIFNIIKEALSSVISGRENIPEISEDIRSGIPLSDNIKSPEPFEEKRIRNILPAKTAFNGYENISDEDSIKTGVFREKTQYDSSSAESAISKNEVSAVTVKTPEPVYEQVTLKDAGFLSEKAKPDHRIIGEVFNTYWIVEYDEKMFIIDQHAAHEKVLYERFMKAIQENRYDSQFISPGLVIKLSAIQEETLSRHISQFEKLGFEISEFGGSDYIITAVPADLYGLNDSQLFISLIDELAESPFVNAPEILENRIATAACKAAVKGGNRISLTEADHLIDELLSCENPYNCPHGRPTIISMSKPELEKKFKRII